MAVWAAENGSPDPQCLVGRNIPDKYVVGGAAVPLKLPLLKCLAMVELVPFKYKLKIEFWNKPGFCKTVESVET